VLRLLRRTGWCVRLCRTLCQGRKLSTAAKHKVTQNKSRYVDLAGNFDLDLTYIKKNTTVIAMSVPTDDCIRGLYLNRLADVVRFFETKHSSSFRIYMLAGPSMHTRSPVSKRQVDKSCAIKSRTTLHQP